MLPNCRYLLRVLEKIPSVELEEALLVLPFAYILKLLPFLDTWIEDGKAVERCSRCLLFLLKVSNKGLAHLPPRVLYGMYCVMLLMWHSCF